MANNFKRSIQDKEYSTRSTFTVVLIEKSIHSGRSFLRFGKILLYFPRVVDQKKCFVANISPQISIPTRPQICAAF
jgi:hypothetical protein